MGLVRLVYDRLELLTELYVESSAGALVTSEWHIAGRRGLGFVILVVRQQRLDAICDRVVTCEDIEEARAVGEEAEGWPWVHAAYCK